jgi:hypothetical protein
MCYADVYCAGIVRLSSRIVSVLLGAMLYWCGNAQTGLVGVTSRWAVCSFGSGRSHVW